MGICSAWMQKKRKRKESVLKRIVSILLLLIFLMTQSAVAFALEDDDIYSRYALLMDVESGAVLYSKAGEEQAFPASTTKIMTLILALELGDLDEIVTVGNVTDRGSVLGISEGDKLSLRSLIYGMMLVSGNDCAEAIAIHLGGGTVDGFVDIMNDKAAEIGLLNTNYVEPSGLHDDNHYTTALDMANLTRYCLIDSPEAEDFRAVVGRETFTISDWEGGEEKKIENSNKLIHTKEDNESYEFSGAFGVKTGDTNYAQRCLVGAAAQDGTELIAVLLYDEDADNRYISAARMFEYGFDNIARVDASSLGLPVTAQVSVNNASFDDASGGLLDLDVNLSGQQISGLTDRIDTIKNNASNITLQVETVGELTAPVNAGDVVATVTYTLDGEEILTTDATAQRSVAAMAGGPITSPEALSIGADIVPEEPASPWLFWGILFAVIVIIAFVLRGIFSSKGRRGRGRRSMRTRRGSYIYRR